jgi:DNA polymerase I-like protein with 3'-5' exonuclease and polymerase domains
LFLNNVKPHVFVAMNVFLHKWQILCKDLDIASFASTPIAELKNKEGWKTLDTIIKESDNWKPSERYYYIAKMICHASNYGMKGAAFQLNVLEKSRGQIVLSKAQADDYLMRYHSLFPEITQWHSWVVQQIKHSGMLYNLFGFPRALTGRFDDSDAKEWYAFSPQSTVGVITHIAVTKLQQYINETGRDWDILGNCHDSYLAQCPEGEELELAKVMLEFMCQDLVSPRGEKFRMKAEAQTGYNWAPFKKDKNEQGLVEIKL